VLRDEEAIRPATTFVATALALALAGWAFASLGGSLGHESSVSLPGLFPRSGLKVSGYVDGLYPGVAKSLPVGVKNRYSFRIRVRRIRPVVSDAGFGCSKANLSVSGFAGRLKVPPRRSRWVALQASMPLSATNRCQGAVFPLRFRARATR
jgi:hypothetical protein